MVSHFLKIGASIRCIHRLDIDLIWQDARDLRMPRLKFITTIYTNEIVIHELFRGFIIDRKRSHTIFTIQLKKRICGGSLDSCTIQDIVIIVDHFNGLGSRFYMVTLPGNPGSRHGSDQNQNDQQFEDGLL